MAVGAEQDALAYLSANPGKRSRVTTQPDVELLAVGIDMVELQRPEPTVVSAKEASAARLFDHLSLHRPPPLCDRRGAATLAPVVATPLENELSDPMSLALEGRHSRTVDTSAPRSAGIGCPKFVAIEPVPNRRGASIEFLCLPISSPIVSRDIPLARHSSKNRLSMSRSCQAGRTKNRTFVRPC
jgi:hypothetical protein